MGMVTWDTVGVYPAIARVELLFLPEALDLSLTTYLGPVKRVDHAGFVVMKTFSTRPTNPYSEHGIDALDLHAVAQVGLTPFPLTLPPHLQNCGVHASLFRSISGEYRDEALVGFLDKRFRQPEQNNLRLPAVCL
jgi:hypothetical protein